MISPDFILTAFIVVLAPGTGVIFTVSTGLVHGRAACLFAALGCTLGILPHLAATVLGLAALMHTSAVAFQGLKYAGVAYLFYIAYATWANRAALAPAQAPVTGQARPLVVKAFLLNILNPKLTIFFLAFLPQFIRSDAEAPMLQLMALSAVFMLMTFVVFVGYGLLANGFRTAVMESPRIQDWIRRGFAAAFAGLGLGLAFSDD